MRGDAFALEALQRASEINIPLIVIAELRAGFLGGSKGSENERGLITFLNSQRVRIIYPDENTTHQYARLFQQLKRQGTPIPTNDIWIAALVVQHELILFARDQHFKHIAQIPTI